MALILEWQEREISLFERVPQEERAEYVLLNRIELDFELGPLALTSEEDRHRLLAALAQLRANSGVEETQVDLKIPASWGVTHTVPNPSLSGKELREHLQWELSKALIDSDENYRYNFTFDEEEGIILAALRIRLLEVIEEVMREAGFHLLGLFLQGEPWSRVNLTGIPGGDTEIAREAVGASANFREKKDEQKPSIPPQRRRNQPSWFFWVVLVIGVIIVGFFAWMKFTSPKKPQLLPEPEAKVEEPATTTADTARKTEITRQIAATPRPVPAGKSWADMRQRAVVIGEALDIFGGDEHIDLISFTGDRFLCQVVASEPEKLDELLNQVKNLPSITEVKSSRVPPLNELFRGIVCGRIKPEQIPPSLVAPLDKEIISLGKKYGLKNQAFLFTGNQQSILDFLNGLAIENYAIYRVILLPWGNNEYRTVLEL